MVSRPVFAPMRDQVGVMEFESKPFIWHPGFALSQKQKNVEELHEAILRDDPTQHPLEISSRSKTSLGVNLSAFNLGVWRDGKYLSVESVYQASKVFAGNIGPHPEWYSDNPGEVRNRIRDIAGAIVAYRLGHDEWGLNPTRAFYNWVYCRALHKNKKLIEELSGYTCFTDIAFNPQKSLNCQAYAISLYLSLVANGVADEALSGKDIFLRFHPVDIVELRKTIALKRKRNSRLKKSIHQLVLDV